MNKSKPMGTSVKYYSLVSLLHLKPFKCVTLSSMHILLIDFKNDFSYLDIFYVKVDIYISILPTRHIPGIFQQHHIPVYDCLAPFVNSFPITT